MRGCFFLIDTQPETACEMLPSIKCREREEAICKRTSHKNDFSSSQIPRDFKDLCVQVKSAFYTPERLTPRKNNPSPLALGSQAGSLSYSTTITHSCSII